MHLRALAAAAILATVVAGLLLTLQVARGPQPPASGDVPGEVTSTVAQEDADNTSDEHASAAPERPQEARAADSEQQAARLADAATGRPASPAMATHAGLHALPAEARNHVLGLAVRAAEYPCETINSATADADVPLWRVSCAGPHVYQVSVDEIGQLRARPMGHWDGVSPSIEAPDRIRNLDLVEPPRAR